MKEFNISEEHAKVLKEHGCYDAFMANIQNPEYRGVWRTYDPDERLSRLVFGGFTWHNTPEGIDYWREIRDKIRETES